MTGSVCIINSCWHCLYVTHLLDANMPIREKKKLTLKFTGFHEKLAKYSLSL